MRHLAPSWLVLAVVLAVAAGCGSSTPAPDEERPVRSSSADEPPPETFTWDDPEIRHPEVEEAEGSTPRRQISFAAVDERTGPVRATVTDREGTSVELDRVRLVRSESGLFGSSDTEMAHLPIRYASGELRVPLARLRTIEVGEAPAEEEGADEADSLVPVTLTGREDETVEGEADPDLKVVGDAPMGEYETRLADVDRVEIAE